MKIMMKRLGFSRFESLLGFGLLAVIVLVALPPLRGGLQAERPTRATMKAEMVAHAVLDYHTDIGHWPIGGDGQTDLSLLVPTSNQARALAVSGSKNSATNSPMTGTLVNGKKSSNSTPEKPPKSWLKEVPVDPWDRPFRVVVMGYQTGFQDGKFSSGYPDAPPAGTAVVVISAGPNGLYDTDLAMLWSADLTGRLIHDDGTSQPQTGNAFGGDDLGFVLTHASIGGQ